MKKTINRTATSRTYEVKVIDTFTDEIKTLIIECADMNDKEAVKYINNQLTENKMMISKKLIKESKCLFSMPAKDFYRLAEVKSESVE